MGQKHCNVLQAMVGVGILLFLSSATKQRGTPLRKVERPKNRGSVLAAAIFGWCSCMSSLIHDPE